MQCHEFFNGVGEWMEGERPADAAAHLEGCARCRGLIADLEVIESTAAHLDDDLAAPPERIWTALRSQLETEGLIRSGGWAERVAGWFTVLPRPALAGAYLALALAVAVFVSFNRGAWQGPEPAQSPASVAVLPAQLYSADQAAVRTMHQHNPVVAATYQENLDVVDKMIRLCEKTIREEPGNELAREYLYSAYQQKAELLSTLAQRGAWGD